MFKKFIAIIVGTAVVATVVSCSRPISGGNEDGKIAVSVSFNALKEFVTAVGGDKVTVTVIIPDGTEPHDFEPKAQDLSVLGKAQIFVMNGLNMESWATDAITAANNTKLIIVDASNGVDVISTSDAGTQDQSDPHIWLSLQSAEIEVLNIKDALVEADPDNKTFYENNYNGYIAQLEQLYNNYSAKFSNVMSKNFVTGHAAFAYLCRDFGLTQNSVEDVFAEGEPSAQQMAALIDYCRANLVTTIFSEALMNADIADTLAREAGAQVKAIYTIESNEDGKSYLARMEENLKVIYESLAG